MTGSAIGIDLGTTCSCVGIFHNGKVEILANEKGNRTTPSFVAFTESELLIGEDAKNKASSNLVNTVFDSKRMLGRMFEDESIQGDMKYWPFKVVEQNCLPKIQVEYLEESKLFSPEEISSMVLMKMKEVAEAFLGHAVRDAVVAVPAYFNDSQRQATKDAGILAGLNVMRVINEPTAAAIAYGLDKKTNKSAQNVLIFDLGGGTFDVSILSIADGVIEVKASAGDSHLGGQDFDTRMVAHFVAEFKKNYKCDMSDNKRSMERLRNACETAKRTLSLNTQAKIDIESLYNDKDFLASITRARFEELNGDLFRATINMVEKVVSDAGLTCEQVDEVVLVGGSSRIPKVQRMLQDLFEGKELNKSISADEAVAYGAAVHAAAMVSEGISGEQLAEVLDVAPFTVGLEIAGGVMWPLIGKNSPIPSTQTCVMTTYKDNQSACLVKVYEGENPMANDNALLGKFELSGIAPAPRGVPQIEVSVTMDVDGVVTVSATDSSTGKDHKITISNDKARCLSRAQMAALMTDAQDRRADADRLLARNQVEMYVSQMRMTMQDEKVHAKEKECVLRKCVEIEAWVLANRGATASEYREYKAQLETACAPMMERLYAEAAKPEAASS